MSGEIPSVSQEIDRERAVDSILELHAEIKDQIYRRKILTSDDGFGILTLAAVLNSGNVEDTVGRYDLISKNAGLVSENTRATLTLASVLQEPQNPSE